MLSCRYALYQLRPACLILSAALLLIAFAPEAYAQEGDPDQPMIVGIVPGPVAAVDLFIKIDDIDGEAEDKHHSDWIDVLSIDWGATGGQPVATGAVARPRRPVNPRARRRADVTMKDVTIRKSWDASSPKLAEACAKGKHIPTLVLEWTTTDADGGKYMRVELQDVVISSYSIFATGDTPTEQVTLNYSKVESGYIKEDQRGQATSAWKVETMDGKSTDN